MMKMAAPVSGPLTGWGIVTAWLAGVGSALMGAAS